MDIVTGQIRAISESALVNSQLTKVSLIFVLVILSINGTSCSLPQVPTMAILVKQQHTRLSVSLSSLLGSFITLAVTKQDNHTCRYRGSVLDLFSVSYTLRTVTI